MVVSQSGKLYFAEIAKLILKVTQKWKEPKQTISEKEQTWAHDPRSTAQQRRGSRTHSPLVETVRAGRTPCLQRRQVGF